MSKRIKTLLIGTVLCVGLTGCQVPKAEVQGVADQQKVKQQEETSVPTTEKLEPSDQISLPDNTDFKPQPEDRVSDIILPLQNKNYMAGLNLINSSDCDIDQDGQKEQLQLYSQAVIDGEGNYQLDDGQEWTLIIKKEDKVYPVFERSFIQLGTLKYTTYTHYTTDTFHILIDCTQGAGIKLYDCYYDVATNSFKRSIVYETQGDIGVELEWKK